jgi:hypothetical protein
MGDSINNTVVPEFQRAWGCFHLFTLISIITIGFQAGKLATTLFGVPVGVLVGLLTGIVSFVPCEIAVTAFVKLFAPKQIVEIPSALFRAYTVSNKFGGYEKVEVRSREGKTIRCTLIGENGVPKVWLWTKTPLRTDEIVAIRKDPKDRDFWAAHSPWVEIDPNVSQDPVIPQLPDRLEL